MARKNPALLRTPLVIAMWEPLARALGWPREPIGFADVLRLASAHAGVAVAAFVLGALWLLLVAAALYVAREGSTATQGDTRSALERARSAVDERLRLYELLDGELDRFYAEMEHLTASLAVVHGQVVRMSVAEASLLQEDVAKQVRDLRERVGALAGGIDEALDQLGR